MNELPEMSDVTELRATLAAMPLLDPPPDVLRRWHAALERLPPPITATPRAAHASADPQPPAEVDPHVLARRLAPSRPAGRDGDARGPDRRRAIGAGILAAAASIAALVGPAGPPHPSEPPADPAPLVVNRADLPGIARTLRFGQPTTPGDQALLAACLARLGADGATVLGSRRVDLEGQPGVLLVLATQTPGLVRTLVVTPDCGPDRGIALADGTSGR